MKYSLLLLVSTLFVFNSFSKDVPGIRPVVDQAGMLSPQVARALSAALVDVKKQTTNEIAVLTVKSLDDETIDSYALKVVETWKLGNKEKDNGVLLLISLNDRKMKIEVGQGLEGDLPDITAGRIIRSIQPYFKRGDYKTGIVLAVSQIVKKTGGTLKNAPRTRGRRSSRGMSSLIFFAIFILASLFGRGGRGGRGGGMLTGVFIGSVLGGGGRSSGFGGGGGFSGGGASGGW